MVRPIKIEFAGAFYHVMSRGLNRQTLFFDDDDHVFFLYLLNQAHEKFNYVCHSYCLMTNHYHLFIQTLEPNLSKIMKFINEKYARYFLSKYSDRDGHVFKGRYKRKIVQSDLYALQLSRYIHLNPVKAGLVEHPHQWKWSSYSAFIAINPKNKFLNLEWLSSQYSANPENRKEIIAKYTYEDIDCNWDPEDYTLGKIVLGSKSFFDYIVENFVSQEDLNEDILAASELAVSKKINPNYLMQFIAKMEGSSALKQKLLIYYLKEHTNLSLKEIGAVVSKTPKTVSQAYTRAKSSLSDELKSMISETHIV